MKTPRYLLVLLSIISVTGLFVGAYSFIHRAASEQVYVFNCGVIDFKPNSLTQFCADANVGVADIKWETWGANGATASATYALNNCEPTCVAGTWKYADVKISLSKPVTSQGKTVLSRLDLKTTDSKEMLPMGTTNKGGWDLESKPLGK